MKEYISIALNISAVLVSVLSGIFIYYFWVNGMLEQISADGKKRMNEAVMKSLTNTKGVLNYNNIELMLMKKGMTFYYKWLNPVTYIMTKLACALIGFLFGVQYGLIMAVLGGFISFYFIDFLGSLSNSSDDKAIVEDIMAIYDTLRLQTKANVFLTKALTECYTVVRNARLKQALLELTGEMVANNEIVNAIEKFTNKFDNQYIDSFGIIVKQSMESGQAVKILEDIGVQLKDLKHLMNEREKTKVSNYIMICQVLIYVGILGLSMFAFMGSMGGMGMM